MPGSFMRLVSIDAPVDADEGSFGPALDRWERLATFRAEVRDILPSRSEAVRQGLEVARNQSRMRMRWRNDIDSTMRVIVHGDSDVVYQIVGGPAEVGGRKRMLELVLERYSSSGADT